jgi:type VII secretion integral membrane protein EccD
VTHAAARRGQPPGSATATAPAPVARGGSPTDGPPAPATAGLVRLSVIAGSRRLDLTVPAILPVAELLPEIARDLGALTSENAYGGFRLVRHDGRTVDADRNLQAQGVEDGAILTLVIGADVAEPRVYDDVVEAVADVIESEFQPWSARRSALVGQAAATAFLTAAAVVLALDRSDHVLVSVAAGIAAAVVLTAAVVLSRRRRESAPAGLLLTGAAAALAAVAGYRALAHGAWSGTPLALAGLGVLLVGAIGYLAIADRRELLLSPVAGGAVIAVVGAVVGSTGFSAASVFAFGLAATVLIGNALGWLAVSWTRIAVSSPRTESEIYAEPSAIHPEPLAEAVRQGHRMLIASSVAVGAVALTLTPVVVGSGITGTVLCLLCGTALMLRTRHSRTTADVAVGLISGVLLLAEIAVAASLQHPGWRSPIAVTLAAAAAGLVGFAALAPRLRVRLGRLADAVDVLNLVALLPLAVAAAGVIGEVHR